MTEGQPRRTSKGAIARSAARLAAVQGLYQMDLAGTDANAVVAELARNPMTASEHDGTEMVEPDATFLGEIVRGVVRRQADIDPLIDQQLAAGWRLARVDSILRAILRSGAFELMERPDVPARVVINEYIELAHTFFAEDESKVVNGVLDKLAHKLREKEFGGG